MPLLDKLREQYGVGPVCSELHIAPSTYGVLTTVRVSDEWLSVCAIR